MSYEIERATPCRVVVTATIGPEEVRSEREHVLGDWLRGARIDGFRKGKAPRALVERRFANEIRDDLEEHLTRRTWDQVRTRREASPRLAARHQGVGLARLRRVQVQGGVRRLPRR